MHTKIKLGRKTDKQTCRDTDRLRDKQVEKKTKKLNLQVLRVPCNSRYNLQPTNNYPIP